MRLFFRLLPVLVASLSLAGCFFDKPLTNGPTEAINTWLLGVWESTDEKGRTSRVMVTPITADRYGVELAVPGKKPREMNRYTFEMWPSRVGDTLFLTLRCLESPGDIPVGGHVFVQPQLLDQNSIRTRGLALPVDPSTPSFGLRGEVRRQLKALALYEGTPSVVWNRTEEVFWSTDGSKPNFTPLRYPTPSPTPSPTPGPTP